MKLLTNNIPTSLNLPVLLAHLIIPYGHSLHVPKGLYEVIAVRIPACILLVAYMDQCITYMQVDMVDCMQTRFNLLINVYMTSNAHSGIPATQTAAGFTISRY